MFTKTQLLWKSLGFYWRINLAVMGAAAIGVAVLTGALLVGDSMRGSLRALTLERLGKIDHALVSENFFREKLADAFSGSAPAIMAVGSVSHADHGRRANRVQALGINERFWNLSNA